MELLATCRHNLNFDDYQMYAKSLGNRVGKERKKKNDHIASLLLVEKNIALGLMHQHRQLRIKKFKKAFQIGSKLKMNHVESIYFHCVAGLYYTYAKDFTNAFVRITWALQFLNSVHLKSLNDSLIAFFELWRPLLDTSLKQVSYQLQLQNIKPDVPINTDNSSAFSLDSSESICQLGSRSFYCELSQTFQFYTSTEEDAVLINNEALTQLIALAVKAKDGLKYDSFEKQYLSCWVYLQQGIHDLKINYKLTNVLAGKSVYRMMKRIEFIEAECDCLLQGNALLLQYFKQLEEKLQSTHDDIKNGQYVDVVFNQCNTINGLPRFPSTLKANPKAMLFGQVNVFIIINVE